MKTFDYPIKDLFNKGLRPTEESPRNGSYLTAISNAIVREGGLAQADKYTRTFNLDEDAQVFTTYSGVYVLTATAIYSWASPTLTSLLSGLTTGGRWSVADFGSYVVFTNGSVNLIRNPITGTFATDDGTLFPLATCLCAHRGRLILGGPKDYPEVGDTNTNWVAWSDINNLDFINTPLLRTTIDAVTSQTVFTLVAGSISDDEYNDLIIVITDAGDSTIKAYGRALNYTGATKEVTLEKDPAIFTMVPTDIITIYAVEDQAQSRQNLSGYMPMPWEGDITRIAPLGDSVVVYGDNGITAIKLLSAPGVASTYGQIPIQGAGLIGQFAMVSTHRETEESTHYYIDNTGRICVIDSTLKKTRMEYKEFFAGDSNLRLSYSQLDEELFIAKSNILTYVLYKDNLTAISTDISSLVYYNDALLIHSPAAIVQDNITFSTDVINFNSNGLKALEWISLNIDCPDDVFVTVRYRDSVKDSYSPATQKQFNVEGVCRIGVRGVDFILDFSIPAYTAIQLSSIKLSVQFIDRRFRRGINVEG